MYPSRGVAEVDAIVEKEIGGRIQRFYFLSLLDGRSHILVPVERCGEIGLRGVVGAREADQVFELLGTPSEPRRPEPWTRRLRAFAEKIRSGSIFDLAEVVRDLSSIATQKPLSFGERHLFETTRKLLVEELSIARGVSSDRIDRQVSRALMGKDRSRH